MKFSRSNIFIIIGSFLILIVSLIIIPLTNRDWKISVNNGKEIVAKKDFEGWSLLTVDDNKMPSYWAVTGDVAKKYKVGDFFDGESWVKNSKDECIKVLNLIKKQEEAGKLNILKEIKLMGSTKSMKPIVVPGD